MNGVSTIHTVRGILEIFPALLPPILHPHLLHQIVQKRDFGGLLVVFQLDYFAGSVFPEIPGIEERMAEGGESVIIDHFGKFGELGLGEVLPQKRHSFGGYAAYRLAAEHRPYAHFGFVKNPAILMDAQSVTLRLLQLPAAVHQQKSRWNALQMGGILPELDHVQASFF